MNGVKFARSCGLLLLAFLVSFSLSAQDRLPEAIRLLQQLYPEAKAAKLDVTIYEYHRTFGGPWNDSPNDFSVLLTTPLPESMNDERPPRCSSPIIRADFTFGVGTKGPRLVRLNVDGLLVTGHIVSVRKEVEKHPEWTEAEMAEALVKSGAKFGPSARTELLAKVPLQQLGPLLGKLHIISSRFAYVSASDPPEEPRTAVLQWVVYLQSTELSRLKRRREYYVALEPIEGKVIAIGVMPTSY